MAADFLAIKSTARPQMGNQTIRLANLLRDLCDLCDALNDGAGHMWDVGDHTMLESQFGLPAGTGANFLALLGNLQTILNTSTDVTGVNRRSQIDEFISRLAGQ